MKTNVQQGMLARVVSAGRKMNTPELVGRIVFVERVYRAKDVLVTVDGIHCLWTAPVNEPTWIVSSSTPMPYTNNEHPNHAHTLYFYERALMDFHLRPLLDPGLDISDQEVRELFSPNRVMSDDLITLRASFDYEAYERYRLEH